MYITYKPVTFDKRTFVWMSDLISITMERSMLENDSALGWNFWRLTSRLLEGGALPLKRAKPQVQTFRTTPFFTKKNHKNPTIFTKIKCDNVKLIT